jgi:hypothetical protein
MWTYAFRAPWLLPVPVNARASADPAVAMLIID